MDFARALRGAAAGIFAILLLCAADAPSGTRSVSVVATFRERLMLPPGAVLYVKLGEASQSAFEAPPIATATVLNPHVPVTLSLAYDSSNIDPGHAYGVSARIVLNGEMWFATDGAAGVITQGKPEHLDLLLKRVAPDSPANLEDRRWTLSEMNGKFFAAGNAPYLDLSGGHVSGSGGCNHMAGGYKLNGNAIAFSAGAVTMMACLRADVAQNETAFFRTLQYVRYWSVSGNRLELLDDAHKTLLAFTGASSWIGT